MCLDAHLHAVERVVEELLGAWYERARLSVEGHVRSIHVREFGHEEGQIADRPIDDEGMDLLDLSVLERHRARRILELRPRCDADELRWNRDLQRAAGEV